MQSRFIAALAAVILTPGAANAGTTAWGLHSPVEVGSVTVAPGSFLDLYTFTIASSSALSSTAVAANVSITVPAAVNVLEIIGGTYSLWSAGLNGAVGGGDDSSLAAWTWGFNGASGSTSNTVTPLASGHYYYAIGGLAQGVSGGHYTLVSTVTALPISGPVPPVPEPETYAMMLAGLGAIGFLARRRRNN